MKVNILSVEERSLYEALQWWRGLSPLRKTQICDTNTELIGSVRRWETLTSKEIKALYYENIKDIPPTS